MKGTVKHALKKCQGTEILLHYKRNSLYNVNFTIRNNVMGNENNFAVGVYLL